MGVALLGDDVGVVAMMMMVMMMVMMPVARGMRQIHGRDSDGP